MQAILDFDRYLFLLINGAHAPVVDFVMYWASNKWIWIPLYAYMLFALYRVYGLKFWYFLPAVALLITASDQLSDSIKDLGLRLRPCHEIDLQGLVHLVKDHCGGQFGFFSSHATNSAALCTFFLLMLPSTWPDLRKELIAYTLIVGYSRIYLGAHYPGDVLTGWICGILIGLILAYFMKKIIAIPLPNKDEVD